MVEFIELGYLRHSVTMAMVRPAEERDLEAINRIENEAIDRTFAHFGVVPVNLEETQDAYVDRKHPWFIKDLDEGVVAFARASTWKPREAYRWTTEVGVYVDPEHHGKGFGQELYRHLFQALESNGFRTIVAGIALPNDASVRLHEAMRMKHVGTLPNMGFKMGEWRSVGYWALTLGDGPPELP
ncbi:MAG: N-acetyltransferase [Chlorobia bacterium]|nr:N-acetyltransferase [Fimbriimonadaceae bacterium]